MRITDVRPTMSLRLALCASVAVVVAGCSSDSRRFAGPAPWSSAMEQHNQAFNGAPRPDTTGSLPPPQTTTPPPVQQTTLPPPAQGQWTPPPARAPAPPPAQQQGGMNWQQGPAPRQAQQTPPPQPAAREGQRRLMTQTGQRTHTVADGETLSSIARRYNVAPGDLARVNHFGPRDRLQVGQSLVIPQGAAPPQQQQAQQPPARREAAAPPPPPATPPQQQARRTPPPETTATIERRPEPEQRPRQPAPMPQPQPRAETPPPAQPPAEPQRPAAAPPPAQVPEPPRATAAEFRWPVRGRVVQPFGRQPGGGQSDGIGIAVPAGTPVKAAENGVVAYAGNELRGYGNLILIRHEGDWVTAYAHNAEILVRRGETVRRGQVIARAGQTGSAQQPMVHFEIRRGSQPVNPTAHLTGG